MRKRARQESAFLNIPYDQRYESLYLGGSLFEARPFKQLVFVARRLAQDRISSL
jgi:hypothetical protein